MAARATSRSRASKATAARPSGPVAAVLLATGIGALVLAVLTCWAEASEGFKESLAYSDRVGPLAGKTIWATAAFLISWGGLTALWGKRDVDLNKVLIASGVLLALGLVGTFAPFFEMFAPEE